MITPAPRSGDNAGVPASLALEFTTTVLVIIGVASVVLLVMIVVAPWRRVRNEPPLDRDVETRLLLHRANPEEVTGEMPAAPRHRPRRPRQP